MNAHILLHFNYFCLILCSRTAAMLLPLPILLQYVSPRVINFTDSFISFLQIFFISFLLDNFLIDNNANTCCYLLPGFEVGSFIHRWDTSAEYVTLEHSRVLVHEQSICCYTQVRLLTEYDMCLILSIIYTI